MEDDNEKGSTHDEDEDDASVSNSDGSIQPHCFRSLECAEFLPAQEAVVMPKLIHYPCRCGEYAPAHVTEQKLQDANKEITKILHPDVKINMLSYTPSKTYGTIVFESSEFPTISEASYARASYLDVEQIYKYLRETGVSTRLISVLTCQKSYKVHSTALSRVCCGITKAAKDSDALVIMDGADMLPVMEISQFIWHQNFNMYKASEFDSRVNYIAVMPWGNVNERKLLESNGGNVVYKPNTMGGALPGLSRFQEQFLFIDDGLRNYHESSLFDGVLIQIEEHLRQHPYGTTEVNACAVLVGGDFRSLANIVKRIQARIPTIICGGTGLAADLLMFVRRVLKQTESTELSSNPKLKKRLIPRLKHLDFVPQNAEKGFIYIQKIMAATEFVFFCDLMANESLSDVILQSMFMTTQSNMSRAFYAYDILRPDLLDYVLNEEPNIIYPEDMSALQNQAIARECYSVYRVLQKYNKNEVVCPHSWLLDVYQNEESSTSRLARHFKIDGDVDDVFLITLFAKIFGQEFAERLFTVDYSKNLMKYPHENIFFLSVIAGKCDMAQFMLGLCQSPLTMAIFACRLFRITANVINTLEYDNRHAQIYLDYGNTFENLATDIAVEIFKLNSVLGIHMIVVARVRALNSLPALEMARQADCKTFLSTLPCQLAIRQVWTGNIHCNGFLHILTMFCPLLLLSSSWFHFGPDVVYPFDKEAIQKAETELPTDDSQPTFCSKLKRFYECPKTKFVWNLLFFLTFLVLASYTVLFDMDVKAISIAESTVIIIFVSWILSTIVVGLNTRGIEWLEIVSSVIMVIYMALRFWGPSMFKPAYTAYVCVLLLLYFELLDYCLITLKFGPKVMMIAQMLVEMVLFLPFLVIFMFAFGVAERANLYPHQNELSLEVLTKTFTTPMYRIFGENALDETRGIKENCTAPADGLECPRGSWFTMLLVAVYVMLTVVLLMNLLIAVLSNIFGEVDSKSMILWKCKRYDLTKAFYQRSIVPWPFGVVVEMGTLIISWIKSCHHKLNPRQMEDKSDNNSESIYVLLENMARTLVLERRKQEGNLTIDAKLSKLTKEVEKFEVFLRQARIAIELPESDVEEDEFDTPPDVEKQQSQLTYISNIIMQGQLVSLTEPGATDVQHGTSDSSKKQEEKPAAADLSKELEEQIDVMGNNLGSMLSRMEKLIDNLRRIRILFYADSNTDNEPPKDKG